MGNNTVKELNSREVIKDTLTDVLRQGAKKILQEALEIEVENFIQEYRPPAGRPRRCCCRAGPSSDRDTCSPVRPGRTG